jgi:hypothetical protein
MSFTFALTAPPPHLPIAIPDEAIDFTAAVAQLLRAR